jgi:Tfp pilus assembly protein PilN
MRLDINLASRPYEDARDFWVRWGLGVGLPGVLTVVLLVLAVRGWTDAGRDRQNIARLKGQIAELNRERAHDKDELDLPANRSTRDQSQFLNELIQRKSFSWTRVFEDLEQVIPPNLHVVSLKPELNDRNQMQLDMTVACDTRAAAVELVYRMEGSRHFQGAQLVSEGQKTEGGPGVIAAVIAIYVPDSAQRSGK